MNANTSSNSVLASLAMDFHSLESRAPFARRAYRDDYQFEELKDRWAMETRTPRDEAEMAMARFLAKMQPRPMRRRIAAPPALTLDGVEPVTVMEWGPGRGTEEVTIGYNVTRPDGSVEFRARRDSAPPITMRTEFGNVEVIEH